MGVYENNLDLDKGEQVTRNEFFQTAVQPDVMPDEINLHLVANKENIQDGRGFSVEGFEAIGYQFHDFAMARTLAYYTKHGHFPTGLRAEVKLVWDDDRGPEELNRDSDEPWYQVDSHPDGTPIALDGSHRLSPFLKDRTAPEPPKR